MSSRIGTCYVATGIFTLSLLVTGVMAQPNPPDAPVSGPSADNTRINERDKSHNTIKPTDQPNNPADVKIAAAVRRSIVEDKTLSTMAHNIKLIAVAGAVTLRGPVANEDEKVKIGNLVANVSGVTSVDNQLDVKQ